MYNKFSRSRIGITSLIVFLISAGIVFIDITYIKNNAFIFLKDYDSIITTIWGVQVTLSTLVVAFLSIFNNRLDDMYYGLTVKEILAIKENKIFGNYYERIFLIIIFNGLSLIPVVFNSVNGIIFLALIQLYILINIFSTSILVSMDDSYSSKLAQKYVDELLINTNSQNCDITEKDKDEKQKLLADIIKKILKNISQKNKIILEQDKNFMFIIKVMNKSKNRNKEIISVCNTELLHLFNDLIRKQDYETAYDVARWLLHSENVIESIEIIRNFCYLHYKRNLDDVIYNRFIDYLKPNFNQHLDGYLDIGIELMMQISLYTDAECFKEIMRSAHNYSDKTYNSTFEKEEFSHAVASYLYYLGVKEPYYIDQFGIVNQSKVKCLIISTFSKNATSISCSDILKAERYLYGIPKCHELLKFEKGSLRYKYLVEFRQFRQVKIDNDINEYSIFMIYENYKKNIDIFNYFEYDFLIKLRQSLTDDGMLTDTLKPNYTLFCEWINWSEKEANKNLLKDLDLYLKNKALEIAKNNRADVNTRSEKISKLREDTIKLCEDNPFYINECESDNDYEAGNYEYIEDINSYSKRMQVIGMNRMIYEEILNKLFYTNEHHMKRIAFNILHNHSKFDVDKFLRTMYYQFEKDTFSINLNEDACNFFRYRDFNTDQVQSIKKLASSIKHLDFFWDIGRYVMIYIDESKFKPQFTLDEDCIEEVLYLSHEEIEEYMFDYCYKNKKFYIELLNDIKIECSKEECYEYIKESKFKLKARYKLSSAKKQFGIVVYLN